MYIFFCINYSENEKYYCSSSENIKLVTFAALKMSNLFKLISYLLSEFNLLLVLILERSVA